MTTATVITGLQNPEGLAIDSNGNLYVANTGGGDAEMWIPSGSGYQRSKRLSLTTPTGIAVDQAGTVYVTDISGSGSIVRWNPATGVSDVVIQGSQATPIDPEAITADAAGHLYVADWHSLSILRYANSSSGWYPSTMASGKGLFSYGLALDQAGAELYFTVVNGFPNASVSEVPSDGSTTSNCDFIASIPNCSGYNLILTFADGNHFPYGVAVDRQGNVYVSDQATGVVERIAVVGASSYVVGAAAGTVSDLLAFPGNWSVKNDTTWLHPTVSSGTGSTLLKVNYDANSGNAPRTGTLEIGGQRVWITQAGVNYAAVGQFNTLATGVNTAYFTDVAVDSAGNVYYLDTVSNQLRKLDPAGSASTVPVAPGYTYGISVDGQGNVYSATAPYQTPSGSGGAIYKFNATASQLAPVIASGINYPTSVAVDGQDNFYTVDYGAMTVMQWAAAGSKLSNVMSVAGPFGNPGFPWQRDAIAEDLLGNLYVADYTKGAVVHLPPPSPCPPLPLECTPPVVSNVASLVPGAAGVAVDGQGNVYYTSSDGNTISEFNAATGQTTSIVGVIIHPVGTPAPRGPVTRPMGIAVDSQGNLYVADAGDIAIKKYTRAYVAFGQTLLSEGAGAGTDSVAYDILPAAAGLSPSPSTTDTWLSVTGVGGGKVTFSFEANTTGSLRTGTITVFGAYFTVSQASLGAAPVPATVTTAPPGLMVTVDGSSFVSPYSTIWLPGSQHTISAPSPQGSYTFVSWSNSGPQTQTITAPAVPITLTATYSQGGAGAGLGFYAIAPCRAVDTRTSQNKTGAFGPPAMAAYSGRDFPLEQSGCGIPATAQAYSLNFTVVPPGPLDFLSAWPSNQPFPGVSTLNSPDGSTVANAAIVPNDPNGKIEVTTGNATDLIIDTNGYFAPPNGNELAFYPMTPCRVVDTRPSQGKSGVFGPPALSAYSGRTFPIRSSSCNVPSTAQAYALNLTVVPPGPLSFLSIWPADKPFPGVSTLNSNDGSIIANAAIVPAAANGDVTVTAGNATDFIMDINGYFAAPGAPGALHFYSVAPCRVADTRPSQGFTGAFGPPGLPAYQGRSFPIQQSACGIPATAKAYSLNITVVPQQALSFLSVWPSDKPFPGVSTLNSPKGLAIANAAIVPAAANGSITVTAGNPTDLIIDINGYFAP